MSILMDALKRQQHTDAPKAPSSRLPFWLGLLVGMVGLSVALAVGYWLGQQHQIQVLHDTESVTTEPVLIANQQHILSALTTKLVNTVIDNENKEPPAVEPTVQTKPMESPQVVATERPAQASMSSLHDIDELDVTSELQQRFSQAMDATSRRDNSRQDVRVHHAPAVNIDDLDQLTRRQLPALRFEAHVYASTPSQRWVKVNGRTIQQGQWLSTDVQVVEILPNYVLLRFHQQEFSVEALTDWSYR